jgi:RNA polymerase sigma factor (TIGR02999 family)
MGGCRYPSRGVGFRGARLSSAPKDDVSRVLDALGTGDPRAVNNLLELVYEELRKLAAARMARERGSTTLQPTALVHEAYMRLVGGAGMRCTWQNRAHFFAAAAEAMRRILIDRARERRSLKRGGGWRKLELDPAQLTLDEVPSEIVDLDEALNALSKENPRLAELVKLRFYAGLSHREAAEVQGTSVPTADRNWAYARAWLFRYMKAVDASGMQPPPGASAPGGS